MHAQISFELANFHNTHDTNYKRMDVYGPVATQKNTTFSITCLTERPTILCAVMEFERALMYRACRKVTVTHQNLPIILNL